ncbi:PAS domain-containing protein [Acidimicrobiia bacterium EGI L10123]|uniref:sensor histidine kinase n=1 Tax=Salinilacustrithrix flava TaxID=2957203 RepID=UPI003D7C26AC|nr:PAS domain-containing protein [Acidimicrobiia bacterium EGI L10123]
MAESAELRRVLLHLQSAHRLAGIGSWEADLDGAPRLRWSPEVHEIAGLPLDQKPTFEDFVAMVHPDDRPLFLEARSAAIAGERPYAIDLRVVLPNGGQRQIHIVAEVIRDEDGTAVRLVGAVQDRTDQLEALRRLRLTEVARRDLLQRLLDTAEIERKRLGRHLESGPIDRLAEIEQRLAASIAADASPRWTDALTAIRKAIDSLHDTLTDIQAEPSTGDLAETVGILVAETVPDVDVTIDVDVDMALRPPVRATLLRVVQEALHNIRKHAGAGRASVTWSVQSGCAHVTVADDGRGFDVGATQRQPGHLGIVAMRDRVVALGGELDIRSRPGRTVVDARLPLA